MDPRNIDDFALTDLDAAVAAIEKLQGEQSNVTDVYPLTPLQEGLLFHHLMDPESGSYVLSNLLEVDSRVKVDALIGALQQVIDRHDILRIGILWEGLPRPVQVVNRDARLRVRETTLDSSGDIHQQLTALMIEQQRGWDLRQAPLVRVHVAADPAGLRWYVLLQLHHVVCDYGSLRAVVAEIVSSMLGREERHSRPAPYREHVDRVLESAKTQDGESFFSRKLADVTEPTVPFGLTDEVVDRAQVEEARELLDGEISDRLRRTSRELGVSVARLFHAAWSVVVAHTSARDDVIFGTVVLANWQRKATDSRILGMSINTLPLRLQLRDRSVLDLIKDTHHELSELLAHEQTPLVVAQRGSGVPASTPLFSSLLNFRHAAQGPDTEWAKVRGVRLLAAPEAATNYPIALTVDDLRNGFVLIAQTAGVEPRRILGYFTRALKVLVDALEHAPETPALALDVLPEGERQLVLRQFNATACPYPRERLIHELFERQAQRTPHAVAVEHEGMRLTYADVNRRANKIARYLEGEGVRAGQLIGICVERSAEMIIGLLGILKAGAAYVPLDPNYPADRLQYMLDDASPRLVLTQEKLWDALPAAAPVDMLAIDGLLQQASEEDLGNIPARELGLTSNNLVYVIYTSGSTGRPKGTAMSHRSMVNLIEWHRKIFVGHEGRRVLQFAALSFDVAFQETFSTLCTGGTLVLLDEWVRRDVRALAEFLRSSRIERLFLPPLMLQSLAEHCHATGAAPPAALQDVITAGEQLRVSPEIVAFFERLHGCRLHNHYGPTETHVVTALTLADEPGRWPMLPPIGKPIDNTRIYVLDGRLQPTAIGVPGEIYIGGAGVAQGYLDRPDLTEQRFVIDPFDPESGGRMYRTGDLGRWRSDGTLDYLGRNDDQVKIRGYRIELGEIEAQLARHPLVKEAAVVAREVGPGDRRLVAYVTWREGSSTNIQDLRTHVKSALPEYMVPAAFVELERLPLTPSGKLDRRSLPAPEFGNDSGRGYAAPENEIETKLAEIWSDVLRVARVGRNDNFFELGGHSLLIVQVLERLRRAGLSAEVRSVYETPVLADLARALMRGGAEELEVPANLIPRGSENITPGMLPLVNLEQEHIDWILQSVPGGAANVQDIYPLAPLQQGILFHHLLHEERRDTYVVTSLLRVASRSELNKLIAAFQTVIDRHDILRTAVLWERLPQAVQVVYRQAILPVDEIELDPDSDSVLQLRERMKLRPERLDIRRAPMVRLQIAADPGGAHWYVLLQMHHLTHDHDALETVIAEVSACMEGRAQQLPEPAPYRNHVAQALRHADRHDAEAFFRSKLSDVDEPTAPFGLLDVHGDGSRIDSASQMLEDDLAQRVRGQARRLGVSAATLFHAAWFLVISQTSGRDDVVFGTVLLGRLHGSAGAQRTLGMFINSLPLRLRLAADTTAIGLVRQTQKELVELLSHEQASLAVAQRCSGMTGTAPLFSAVLNYRHNVIDLKTEFARAGVELIVIQSLTNYPILLSVDDLGHGFVLTGNTDRRVNPRRLTEYMHTALTRLVEALEGEQEAPVLRLSVLPTAERIEVTESFNDTVARYPQDKTIHELFEEQVLRAPNAVAAVHDGRSLTYAELNLRANQVARHLRSKGVGPDQLVALYVERSLDMMIGLIGILKAGGAYVPLDPSNPIQRLEHLLSDAKAAVLLTQSHLVDKLPTTAAEVVILDKDWQQIEAQPGENLDPATLRLTSSNLAYVIYTSGSTGKPKGVMIEHRNIVNYATHAARQFDVAAGDGSLMCTSISFDLALTGFYPPLICGRTVRLCKEEQGLPALAEELAKTSQLAPLKLTPSHIGMLEHALRAGRLRDRVRVLVLGGEQLQAGVVQLWRTHAPGTRIFNHYGPTETTVGSVVNEVSDQTAGTVPIGRPISNTRIYVLDRRRQPVPIGVVGEIFIAGAGVGRGYLNNPDLTAERFLPDPFDSDPRSRMYKTGDLGRWSPQGTVEYLGRNDEQVKIRGFRIELGEIEAHLRRDEEVREAVVIAREDTPGEKRLVAYVTLHRQGVSTEHLRGRLKASLPAYMLPSAFVVLQSLPLTSNGKLDRRALPAPETGALLERPYEAPQGRVEEELAEIWRELLALDRVGRSNDLFDLGAHSLLVLKALFKINARLGSDLNVGDIYRNPTVSELAARVSGRASTDDYLDLAREATLDESVVAKPGGCCVVPAKAVLLTGATGFLGRFVLSQLLQDTDATIYCLVRASSVQHAALRLRTALVKWDLWQDELERRVVVIPGDLRQSKFGMAGPDYDLLSRIIDSVYHCATSMNHLETYSMAKQANVESARQLVQFAIDKPKLINYVSTLSVFSSLGASTSRVVDELTPLDQERHPRSRGYAASKWVAEKIFLTATGRGVACNVFRLGLVWADTKRGRYDELQRDYRLMKSCLLSGYGIQNFRYELSPVPVDYAARAIVSLASAHGNGGGIFHVATSQVVEDIFERCNRDLESSLELIPYYDWICEMKRLHENGRSLPVVPLIEFAFSMDRADFEEHQHRIQATRVRIDSSRTARTLAHGGIVIPALNDDLIRTCVDDMLTRDRDLRESIEMREPTLMHPREDAISWLQLS